MAKNSFDLIMTNITHERQERTDAGSGSRQVALLV